ncbi:hypothetical protein CERSUDRAFT_122553 [Gelatoporia subvermispora B]|uniref:PQ-loop-domain-containing protein n=1 Tax=Ceriporiopsis subvermispora (strain B) TaxID=914234 RepID=M2PR76_CERS8|nr:hypothetical protein CERSUDRAFT_122553 [Gelatoporia subvermispora B]
MPANPAAENALGTIGTICWTVQLIPQIWKSWRDKSTEGLSHWLLLMWGISGAFLGVYSIVQDLNIPLILQPQLFGVLSFVSWGQCQYYGKKRSRTMVIVMVITAIAVTGGFEAGMVYAVRPSFNRGNDGPVEAFGIISAIIISLALLPQYYEIHKHREVVGISMIFMTVDCLGGIFNDLSLAFKAKFDITAGVTYSMVVLLDGTVLLLAATLNPLARRRRKRAAAEAGDAEDGSHPRPLLTVSEPGTPSIAARQDAFAVNEINLEMEVNRV